MALLFGDRAFETTQTTGTSAAFELDGAVSAIHRKFVDEIGHNNTTYYVVSDDTYWELWYGNLTAGTPDSITRGTFIKSNTGSQINWTTGTRNIFAAPPSLLFNGYNKPGDAVGIVCCTNTGISSFAQTTRTLQAGTNISINNPSGLFGNPSIACTIPTPSWETKVGNFTAAKDEWYRIDGGAVITLPSSPSDGDLFRLWDYKGECGADPASIDYVATDIMGVSADYALDVDKFMAEVTYVSALSEWRLY